MSTHAVVSPQVCRFIVERLDARTVRTEAHRLRGVGAAYRADELLDAWRQLSAAARSLEGRSAAPRPVVTDEAVRWISTAAAAERLGVGAHAVRKRLRAGTLSGELVGRTWRVDAAEVERIRSGQPLTHP